jgi:LuxR family maltose regulon positive regulatory protein
VEGLVYARLVLAQVLAARGELEAARGILDETFAMQPRFANYPFLVGQVGAAKAILDCQGGRTAAARRWAESLDPAAHSLIRNAEWLTQARVLLAADLPAAALAVLEALPNQARGAGLEGVVVQALALQACARQQVGDADAALATLRDALQLAEAEGFLRSFVDTGLAMAALLRKARHAGIAAVSCTRLLSAFPSEQAAAPIPTGSLLEPLSSRELEVLSLASQGYSNQEIARRLFVAESTIKSHLNAILRKLDAANRTEAASRARELGLIG